MNNESERGTFADSVKKAVKNAQDKKTAKRDRLKFKKLTWLGDSFIISLILSIIFASVVCLASQEVLTRKSFPYMFAMACGITGTIYRLRSFNS